MQIYAKNTIIKVLALVCASASCITPICSAEQQTPQPLREQDVAMLAQAIIFQRKTELVSYCRTWAEQAQAHDFTDAEVLTKTLEVATALDILELYAMGLEYSVVNDAKIFYTKCFAHWNSYSKETQAVLTKIFGTITKYFKT